MTVRQVRDRHGDGPPSPDLVGLGLAGLDPSIKAPQVKGSQVKGWCPGALRPMVSGDGLILRIRPRLAQITVDQAHGIADLAAAHGNGFVQLTNRANLQIRGVTDAGLPALTKGLAALDLLDHTPEAEAARNILVTPFWSDTATPVIARALAEALTGTTMPNLLNLPGKFGFAVDTAAPVSHLSATRADIRIETAGHALIVRADGAEHGLRVDTPDQAVAVAIALARWFAASGGIGEDGRGRMRTHLARGAVIPQNLAGDTAPNPAAAPFQPGQSAGASGIAFAFGQIDAVTLHLLADAARSAIRLTPWHAIVLIGPDMAYPIANHPDLITTPDNPLLRVTACTGAPGCAQAHAETRSLARSLAGHIPEGSHLHVSGCAKGCAHPEAAPVTLTATPDGFSLVRNGRAGDTPERTGLAPDLLRTSSQLFRVIHPMTHMYETDGAAIYRQSFAMIRAEADLGRFTPEEEICAVRMIHAAGMVGLERFIRFTPGMAIAARLALEAGAPILCDARMVSTGITPSRLPAQNRVICTLHDPAVRDMAQAMGTTRSAAALELWRPHLDGAVVAIGNAPTALFHLLNMLADPACPRPAAIIGCPVGFVGAAESKDALMAAPPVPSMIVQGRLGGSAITVAAVNALASRVEI